MSPSMVINRRFHKMSNSRVMPKMKSQLNTENYMLPGIKKTSRLNSRKDVRIAIEPKLKLNEETKLNLDLPKYKQQKYENFRNQGKK